MDQRYLPGMPNKYLKDCLGLLRLALSPIDDKYLPVRLWMPSKCLRERSAISPMDAKKVTWIGLVRPFISPIDVKVPNQLVWAGDASSISYE